MLRRQLPVWSPVTLAALGAGASAALRGRDPREELGARIRTAHDAADVILTDSGTTALALAIRASAPAGTQPRVALPAYGCFDLMTAADAVGAEVVLYDLDPATLAPDRESLRTALRQAPHAAVVAHWYGVPVELEPIAVAVAGAGAVLIEDAAQGVGAAVGGRPAGSLGSLAVLSFGRGKGRTGGRGGALLVRDANLSAATRRAAGQLLPPFGPARDLGVLAALLLLGRPSLYWLPVLVPGLHLGETLYRPAWPGSELPAALAAVVLTVWEPALAEAERRRGVAARWLEVLKGMPDVDPISISSGVRPGWLRFPLRARGSALDTLRSAAARRHGVMPGYPSSLAQLQRAILNPEASFRGAGTLVTECLTLPTHRMVGSRDITAVARMLGRSRSSAG
jgi:perosamine synthetase